MKTIKSGISLLLTVACLVLCDYQIYAQQTASQLFEKALYIEEAKGELQQAIDLYQQILKNNPENRQVAAKALLHQGMCLEKLGQEQAGSIYEDLIVRYPEQKDEVYMARNRLASLEKTLADLNRKPKFRKIEFASKPKNGVLSPDGNELAFMSDGGVWVVPLHGKVDPYIAGEPRRIAEIPGLWEHSNMITWSANGKWIAVYGGTNDESVDEGSTVYVISVDGGKPRIVKLPEQGGHLWSYGLSLSPDGEMLTFSAIEIGKSRNEVSDSHDRLIYTVPTKEGELRKVSSEWARLPSYSPDGEFIAYVGYSEREDLEENTNLSRLYGSLWVAPSGGGVPHMFASVEGRLRGPLWSPDCRYIAVHYEPGSSNYSEEIWIYPVSHDATRVGEPEKIRLPGNSMNMLAGWTPENEIGVFITSEELNAIYTVPSSGGKAVQITPDDQWPYYPRWSPDGKRIYFRWGYVSATGGNFVEVPVRGDLQITSRVPGGGHNISPDGEKIVISSGNEPRKPNEGNLWTISLDDGLLTRLTSDRYFACRYPCWSPDGKWIAFKDDTDTQDKNYDESFTAIYIIPAEGGKIRQITTEADSVGGGAITFSRNGEHIAFFSGSTIKTISVEGGQSKVLVADIQSVRHSQLAYSPDGLKIAHNATGKIWITSLDEGEPQELQTGLPKSARLSEFGWSPDGEKIAIFSAMGGETEFWLISDFLPNGEK